MKLVVALKFNIPITLNLPVILFTTLLSYGTVDFVIIRLKDHNEYSYMAECPNQTSLNLKQCRFSETKGVNQQMGNLNAKSFEWLHYGFIFFYCDSFWTVSQNLLEPYHDLYLDNGYFFSIRKIFELIILLRIWMQYLIWLECKYFGINSKPTRHVRPISMRHV